MGTDAAEAQVRPDSRLGAESSRVRQARLAGRDGVTRDNDALGAEFLIQAFDRLYIELLSVQLDALYLAMKPERLSLALPSAAGIFSETNIGCGIVCLRITWA